MDEKEVNGENYDVSKQNKNDDTSNTEMLKEELKLLQKTTINQVDTLLFTVPYL